MTMEGCRQGYIAPIRGDLNLHEHCIKPRSRDHERPDGGIEAGQFSRSRFGELGIQRTPILSGTRDP